MQRKLFGLLVTAILVGTVAVPAVASSRGAPADAPVKGAAVIVPTLTVTSLRADASVNPLGIDNPTPRLTWALSGGNSAQTAYQILVATAPAKLTVALADAWNSGVVASVDPWAVYGGSPLASRTRYYWTIKVWASSPTGGLVSDWATPAWFETAYMSPSLWQGSWIAGPQRTETATPPGTLDDACCLAGATTLSAAANPGDTRVATTAVTNFGVGGNIAIGTGATQETATITSVGPATAGSTTLFNPAAIGDSNLTVNAVTNFVAGDLITIDTGAAAETAVITAVGSAVGAVTSTVADAAAGDGTIMVASISGVVLGARITVDTGVSLQTVQTTRVGTAASAPTTLAQAAAVGDTNVKVASATGFFPGNLMQVDTGAGMETRFVTAVGTAAATTTLVAAAAPGDTNVKVASVASFAVGSPISVDTGGSLENGTVTALGTAQATTTLFAAAAPGDLNVKVASVSGFAVGNTINIDTAGTVESRTITAVGTQGRNTTLSQASLAGATGIKIASNSGFAIGDTVYVDTGANQEVRTVLTVPSNNSTPNLTFTAALTLAHASGVAVVDRGTGITFAPALGLAHAAAAAVQTPGTGITFAPALGLAHAIGAAVFTPGTGITFSVPLTLAHASGAAARALGTGIDFSPPLTAARVSGTAVQGLGTGISFMPVLAQAHAAAATVVAGTGIAFKPALALAHASGEAVASVPLDYCRLPGGGSEGTCREIRPIPMLRKSFDRQPGLRAPRRRRPRSGLLGGPRLQQHDHQRHRGLRPRPGPGLDQLLQHGPLLDGGRHEPDQPGPDATDGQRHRDHARLRPIRR